MDNDYKKLVRELKAYYSGDIKEILKIEKDLANTVRKLLDSLIKRPFGAGHNRVLGVGVRFCFSQP